MDAPVLGYPEVFEAGALRFAVEAERAGQAGDATTSACCSAAAILLAVATVEASVGEFLYRVEQGQGSTLPDALPALQERLAKANGPYERCKAIARVVRPDDDFFASGNRLSEFKCVYQLRNAVVHYSRVGLPRGEWPREVDEPCAKILDGVRAIGGYDWVSVALTHESATWAAETASRFRSAWARFVYGI